MLVMLTSNSLKVAIGATFFHFWLTFENFLPRFFNNFFSIFFRTICMCLHLSPKTFTEACYIFEPTWETLIFLSFLLITDNYIEKTFQRCKHRFL